MEKDLNNYFIDVARLAVEYLSQNKSTRTIGLDQDAREFLAEFFVLSKQIILKHRDTEKEC